MIEKLNETEEPLALKELGELAYGIYFVLRRWAIHEGILLSQGINFSKATRQELLVLIIDEKLASLAICAAHIEESTEFSTSPEFFHNTQRTCRDCIALAEHISMKEFSELYAEVMMREEQKEES